MTDMKCPFCGKKLEPYYGYGIGLYSCSNLACKGTDMKAEDDVWQELIRTRKALEVAVDALKDIRCIYTGDQTTKPSTMFGRAAGALNKITALEQKD